MQAKAPRPDFDRSLAPLRLVTAALIVWALMLGIAWPAHAQSTGDLPTRLPGHTLPGLARAIKTTPASVPHGVAASQAATPASSQTVTLTVVLNRSDEKGFQQYLADVQNPLSSGHGKFLTQEQLSARFGPSQKAYDDVLGYSQKQGFSLVQGSTNRLTLTVKGTRAQVEQAFSLNIDDYQLNSRSFYANDEDPAVPSSIAADIQAIAGLTNLAQPSAPYGACDGAGNAGKVCPNIGESSGLLGVLLQALRLTVASTAFRALAIIAVIAVIICNLVNLALPPRDDQQIGPDDMLLPGPTNEARPGDGLSSLEDARGPTGPISQAPAATNWQTITGAGQTIGVLEFDTFHTSDVSDWLNLVSPSLGLSPSQINQLTEKPVNGGVSAPGAGEPEVLLDVDTVLALARGANVTVYDSPIVGSAATSFVSQFSAMTNDNVSVISNSWTACEDEMSQTDVQAIDTAIAQAAGSGISVFNAAGDQGGTCSDGSPNTVAVPADSPNATAVGATTLTLGQGVTYGGESLWSNSGFGVSKYLATPSYQQGITPKPAMRSIPDATVPADPTEGLAICQADAGGCPTDLQYGGTSLAAPIWAAMAARLDQAQSQRLGNLNPLLYGIANGSTFHSAVSMGTDFAHAGLGTPKLDDVNLALIPATAGPADATNSIVLAFPNSVPEDGKTTATVQVFVLDSLGNLVSGDSVSLGQGNGHSTISVPSGTSSPNDGSVTFTVTDSTPETVTYTATAGGVTLLQTASVAFSVVPQTTCQPGTPVAAPGFAFTTFASGFPTDVPNDGCEAPIGLAFNSLGNLFVTDITNNTLYKFGPQGGAAGPSTQVAQIPTTVAGTFVGSPTGMAFGKDGKLYLAQDGGFEGGGGQIVEIDPATGAIKRTVASYNGFGSTDCAVGIATDPLSGDLLFTEPPCTFLGGEPFVNRISNPAGASPTLSHYATPGGSDGITIGPDGTIYVAQNGNVLKISGTGAPQPPTITTLAAIPTVDGVAVGANPGNPSQPPFLFANANNGTITKLDLSTNPPTQTSVLTGGSRGDFVAVGPDGCLYATQTDSIIRVSLANGTCPLSPTSVVPQITLAPSAVTPNPNAGTPETFTATLLNVASPIGTPVTFTVTGANPQTATAPANSSGVASFTFSGVNAGTDSIVATATAGSALQSNVATVIWANGKHKTFLNLNNSRTSGLAGRPATLTATLQDVFVSPPVPLNDQSITIGLGTQTCTAPTDSSGNASCTITPTGPAANIPLTANFAGTNTGSPQFAPSSATTAFVVAGTSLAPTAVSTMVSASSVPAGTPVHDSAILSQTSGTPAGTVTYNLYSGSACSGTPVFTSTTTLTNAGTVPISGNFTPVTPGTYNWQAVYSGDQANSGAGSLCGSETLTVTAIGTTGPCLLCVLNPSRPGALIASGRPQVSVLNGGITVNSSSSSAAIFSGNVNASAASIGIAGNFIKAGTVSLTPAPTVGVKPQADPLAGVPAPAISGSSQAAVTLSGTDKRTISQGIYSNISVNGNAILTLSPGLYVITGSVSLSATASLAGNGVTLYFTCSGYSVSTPAPCQGRSGGGLTVNGSAGFNLTAPSTGDDQGLTVFYDRGNAAQLLLNGNAGNSSTGSIYARAAALTLNGNAGAVQVNGLVVVDTITLSGSEQLQIVAVPAQNISPSGS